MDILRWVWSDAVTLLTVGSAVIMTTLAVVCGIAGLCPCAEKAGAQEPGRTEEAVDYTWMRAA